LDRRQQVRDFVAEKVRSARRGEDIVVDDHTSLLLSGLLNSLTMVEIIIFVEREFGLDIAASGIRIEDFDTVASICALVNRQCPLVHNENH
jgi:acyl carrier protein